MALYDLIANPVDHIGNSLVKAAQIKNQLRQQNFLNQLALRKQEAAQQSSAPNYLGKFNPGDYTPDSFAAFMDSGLNDPRLLKRYEPYRVVNIGGVPTLISGAGPSTPSAPLSTLPTEAAAKSELAAAQEGGKQRVRAATEPTIQAEIAGAKGAVARQQEVSVEREKNQAAYNTFKVGLGNLETALRATTTGPLAGRVPALTEEAQTAEGAISMMAPLLKDLFRASGEGVFTDKDQELLLGMIPDRTEHPVTRDNKLKMIDQVVRSKLKMRPEGFGTINRDLRDQSTDELLNKLDEL